MDSKESRAPPMFLPANIYVYVSADGVWRQRCGRHVHEEAWGRPVYVWQVLPAVRNRKPTCIECFYERLVGPGTARKREQMYEDPV